jgi:hypothetical protein
MEWVFGIAALLVAIWLAWGYFATDVNTREALGEIEGYVMGKTQGVAAFVSFDGAGGSSCFLFKPSGSALPVEYQNQLIAALAVTLNPNLEARAEMMLDKFVGGPMDGQTKAKSNADVVLTADPDGFYRRDKNDLLNMVWVHNPESVKEMWAIVNAKKA